MSILLKLASSSVICILFSMFLVLDTIAAEPVWVLLDQNDSSTFYLDSAGTESSAVNNTARVTVRVEYTEKGKNDALDTLKGGDALKSLAESRYSYDIRCASNQSKLLAVNHMDGNGHVLKSVPLEKVTSWELIPEGARLALVAEKVCKRTKQ